MNSRSSTTLYDYWNEVRGDRVAPRRFEIEPARLAAILPDAFILERSGELDIRYRLAGTRIQEQFGFELRGSSFFDGFSSPDRSRLEAHMRRMVREGGGALLELDSISVSQRGVRHECLILPLVHMRDTVDRFVGVLTALTMPEWLGDEPLVARSVVREQAIIPGGVDANTMALPLPPALECNVRAARVVRSERRQFRVYDGGLADRPGDEF
jgi:hypothetical protein